MPEFDDKDFYDLPDAREGSATGRTLNKKRLVIVGAIGIGMLFAAVLLIVFILNVLEERRSTQQARENLLEQAEDTINGDARECDGDADEEACRDGVRADIARTVGEVEVCNGISDGEAYTNCVSLIAFDATDTDVCQILEEEERTSCEDSVLLLLTIESLEFTDCGDIVDESIRQDCEDYVIAAVSREGTCETYGVPEDYCEAQQDLEAMIATGDAGACNDLQGEREDACHDAFDAIDDDEDGLSALTEFRLGTSDQNADSDGDGLHDSDELDTYATDPMNPDTDGDGFDDGTEIAGGYDPLR